MGEDLDWRALDQWRLAERRRHYAAQSWEVPAAADASGAASSAVASVGGSSHVRQGGGNYGFSFLRCGAGPTLASS